jgi:ferrous iron transport protein B
MFTLYDLGEGEEGIILKIKGRGHFRHRLMEMGFIPGKKVSVIRKAPLRDPVEYKLMDYHVSLRNSEAKLIEVDPHGTVADHKYSSNPVFQEPGENRWLKESRHLVVALAGNPNSGKTTLFNVASGSREKVANYAGVTIDSKEAEYKQSGYTFSLIDLPGTYSLQSYSPEEIYVRDFIFEKKPDIIINVVDASNLERNLYLTTQLIDMGVQVVIALNMYDELLRKGDILDHKTLSDLLGIPIIPTISSRGRGLKKLFDKVIETYENKEPSVRHIHINYGPEIESAICALQSKIRTGENCSLTNVIAARYFALELLTDVKDFSLKAEECENWDEIMSAALKENDRLNKLLGVAAGEEITDKRYGFIAGALKETFKISGKERLGKTQVIDNYLTNKYLGIPLFILFLWVTFFATFKLGGYPKQWMESGISQLSDLLSGALSPGFMKDFLIDGLIGGVGGVIVFLPNIIILFLFISFMEDTGYMARAVFIMDKLMHNIGLHGKSFIPLFMGFGCNVPAIMATRIIESRRDRLITMLITPFMSCSARLPVYILFISAFFPKNHGLILLVLYLFGALLAILSAILLKKVYFKTADIPFVMELPPYRIPTARSIFRHVSSRTGQYLRKIGGIILIASVIVWFLSNFPRQESHNEVTGSAMNADKIQSGSIMGHIGHALDPVMRPLGFNWKLSVSILSGIAAKEVVVSTLGILYQADNGDGGNTLVDKLKEAGPDDKDSLNPLVAFSFMLFILTYFPCIGVVSAIRRESGGWKWAVFVVIYTTAVAWLLSFTVYQAGSLLI